mmetsp:Transcript_16293/g.46509  ORF Transcript_16293/g.46509 Transcript_16293/m.46509 type:complete len:474 (-) Transcript_16293:127-1548(-)
MKGASRALQSMDQFRQVSRELTKGTISGGVFTAIAWAVITLLLIAELGAYLRTNYSTSVYMDENSHEFMDIQFDITMFDLPCKYLKVSVWDKFGTERMVSHDNFTYKPLDHVGEPSGLTYTKEEIAVLEQVDTVSDISEDEAKDLDADWASTSDHFKHRDFNAAVRYHEFTVVNFYAEWCVHCRQFHPTWNQAAEKISEKMQFSDGDGQWTTVKFLKMNCVDFGEACQEAQIAAFPSVRLYKRDGSFETFQQKRTLDNIVSFLTTAIRNSHLIVAHHHHIFNEGCQVAGKLWVRRVPGHFNLQAEPFGLVTLNPALTNVSHQVNHFSFGSVWAQKDTRARKFNMYRKLIPKDIIENLTPLDGKKFIATRFHEAPEHYLKVVTTFLPAVKQPVYQMTHTDRTRRLPGKEIVPQARFAYDFSPLSVSVKDSSKAWYEFITSLFAILGGTYTVVELCSSAVDTVHTTVKEMMGKDS